MFFPNNPRKALTGIGRSVKALSEPHHEYYDAELEMRSVLDDNAFVQTEGAFQGESSHPAPSAVSQAIAHLNEPHNKINSTWHIMASQIESKNNN